MNLWKMYKGQWIRNWDHPELINIQEVNGPPNRQNSEILERLFMQERLKTMSLQQVEDSYKWGSITDEELEQYLIDWNATPGRFTIAEWRDGAIRQRERKD